MAEDVQTGGVMKFRYEKGVKQPKISEELKKDIQRGYEEFYARKARKERNRKLIWVLIGLVLLMLLGWAFWRILA